MTISTSRTTQTHSNVTKQWNAPRFRRPMPVPAWNCSRLAISAPRPSERLKLGHDVSLVHATAWRERHLAPTAGDPELKHNLNLTPVGARPGTDVVEALDDQPEVLVVARAGRPEGAGLVVPPPTSFGLVRESSQNPGVAERDAR